MAMEIWNHECGPFWPNSAVFAIVCHIGTTISRWGKEPSRTVSAIIVAYDQGLDTGVIQLLVRSMIPPICAACCFLPHPCGHPLGEQ